MSHYQLTYETVRKWCLKFGQSYANALRRCHPQPGDKWYLDEVFLTIHGRVHYAWRAVDQHGTVLKVLVQRHRDKKAAQKFFRKLLKDLQYVPRVIITDKLASYGAAKREILPGVEHRQHKGLGHPSRELPPTHATTREENAEIQIGQTRATLSLGWSRPSQAIFNHEGTVYLPRSTVPLYRADSRSETRVTGVKLVG